MGNIPACGCSRGKFKNCQTHLHKADHAKQTYPLALLPVYEVQKTKVGRSGWITLSYVCTATGKKDEENGFSVHAV